MNSVDEYQELIASIRSTIRLILPCLLANYQSPVVLEVLEV